MRTSRTSFLLLFALAIGSAHCSDGNPQSPPVEAAKAAASGETPVAEPGVDPLPEDAAPVEEGNSGDGEALPPKPGALKLTWNDVRPITKKYCEDCHLDDGFGREEIWTTVKDSAIVRLEMLTLAETPGQTEEPIGLMPPSETTLGQTMTREEKDKLIKFLRSIGQVERDEVATPPPEEVVKPTLTGEFKALADAHCVRCHTAGKNLSWWTGTKTEIKKRINNGSMPPPSRAFPAEDKQKLLNYIEAL